MRNRDARSGFSTALMVGLCLLLTALWLTGAFFFMLEAWGRRGMAKPWWMGLAATGAALGWIFPLAVPVGILVAGRRPAASLGQVGHRGSRSRG